MGCRMVLCYERDPVRLFSGRFLGRAADLDKTLPLLVDEAGSCGTLVCSF